MLILVCPLIFFLIADKYSLITRKLFVMSKKLLAGVPEIVSSAKAHSFASKEQVKCLFVYAKP